MGLYSDVTLSEQGKIVLVDDDTFILQVYAEKLKVMGYDVIVFEDPYEALRFIYSNSSSIDLIITDFKMPILNGMDMIRCVRSEQIPCLAMILTAYVNDVDVEQARDLDVEVIGKPISIRLLNEYIHSLLSHRGIYSLNH